jgi:sRNA-binding regulator protein Hfq
MIMKKAILVLFAIMFTSIVSAQADKIFLHSGKTVEGKVLKVEEYTIVFVYNNETAENTFGKYAIEKIEYGSSGRTEEVTDKIEVTGEDDWEKVVILEDKSYIAGLTKVGDVRGKTSMVNFQTGNTGDKKAEKKLKMEAAASKCQFILLVSDKSTTGARNTLGGSQAIKTGVTYTY